LNWSETLSQGLRAAYPVEQGVLRMFEITIEYSGGITEKVIAKKFGFTFRPEKLNGAEGDDWIIAGHDTDDRPDIVHITITKKEYTS
jgi:hypothetical protein